MTGLWDRAVSHRKMSEWYRKLLWQQHWNRTKWMPRIKPTHLRHPEMDDEDEILDIEDEIDRQAELMDYGRI